MLGYGLASGPITWVYLADIFVGEDIKTKLPNESLKFSKIDKLWKDTMEVLKDNGNFFDIDAEKI